MNKQLAMKKIINGIPKEMLSAKQMSNFLAKLHPLVIMKKESEGIILGIGELQL